MFAAECEASEKSEATLLLKSGLIGPLELVEDEMEPDRWIHAMSAVMSMPYWTG